MQWAMEIKTALLRPKEACILLGISRSTFYRMERRRLVLPVRLGTRTVRYRLTDLVGIVENGTCQARNLTNRKKETVQGSVACTAGD